MLLKRAVPLPEDDPTSIGNLAIERGYITSQDLLEAVMVQQKRLPLGEILVEMGKLTKDQLRDLIFEQQVRRGEITDKNQIIEFERQKMHRQLGKVREGFQEVRRELKKLSASVLYTASHSLKE
jgi:hypothetical protein